MFFAFLCLDVNEVPYSYIRILTIVVWEDTPQVGSFLPIGLGPIAYGYKLNTRIDITNSRINIRVIMT